MTPEELEALAARVEAGAEDRTLLEALVFSSLRGWSVEWRTNRFIPDDPPALIADGKLMAFPEQGKYRAAYQYPTYLTSLDAAAQVMPPNWAVRIDTWPGGSIDVTARECVPRPDIDGGLWHSTRDGEALGSAPTECAARVAAGLRARAHDARKAGAA